VTSAPYLTRDCIPIRWSIGHEWRDICRTVTSCDTYRW